MKNVRRIIFALLTLGWMLLIFAFSNRDASLSSGDSTLVARILSKIFGQDNYIYNDTIDFLIRKTAHFGEYAILAMLAFQAVTADWNYYKKCGFFAWLLASIYAVTDEVHQLFVPGRAGQFRDVCIDSAGALTGVLVTIALFRFIKYIKMKRK